MEKLRMRTEQHPPGIQLTPAFDEAALTNAEVELALARWAETVSTQDPEKMADLYEKDAVLIGTIATQPAHSRDEITAYFRMFFDGKTDAKVVAGPPSQIQLAGCVATASGLYSFIFKRGETRWCLPARYSLLFRKTAGAVQIMSHHSSANPGAPMAEIP
jgi:uncharacterized protein (TIGR02246 family)